MAFNGPSFVHAQNLAPWNWKYEMAPRHKNLGPDSSESVNKTQRGPLLVDGKESQLMSVGCIESTQPTLPASVNLPVMASKDAGVLEDGK